MKFEPLEHQKLMFDWLKTRDQAALFVAMGLGKSAATLLALRWLFGGGESRGALVIAPLRVSVLTWPHEVKKWDQFKKWRIYSLRTEEGKEAWEAGEGEIFTINYEMLPKFCRDFLHNVRGSKLPVDTVIFDELAEAKNPSSKRITVFRKYRYKFQRFWGLTGTPTPNGLLDIFAQVRLLDDGERLGKAHSHFKQTFFEPENVHKKTDYPKFVIREGREKIIEEKIADLALTLRSEDWLKIPPTTYEDIAVSLPAEAKRLYKELEKELLLTFENQEGELEVAALNAAVLAGKLLQITGGTVYETPPEDEEGTRREKRVQVIHDAKLKALAKLQKQEGGEPLLVGCWFKHERDRILEAFPGAELFDEKTTLPRWNRGEIPMLVAHPKSIGHGLNLQAGGSRIVWFGVWWDQMLIDQFNARLARQGQKEPTKVFRLLVPGTVDDAIAEATQHKATGQSDFLTAIKNLQELARARG